MDASSDWIDLVYLETILNSTPDSDSGYADYTFLSADLLQGNTYNIDLSAGMDLAQYTEHWNVWIDFNRDGDFTDTFEEVVSYSSTQIGWETHTFMVPANATPGNTIMRVSMKNGSDPGPCEIFSLGEVEDYTINILSPTNVAGEVHAPSMKIVPQPGRGTFNVLCSGLHGQSYTLHISDAMGKNIWAREGQINSGMIEEIIPADNFAGGIYFVTLISSNEMIVQRFIK